MVPWWETAEKPRAQVVESELREEEQELVQFWALVPPFKVGDEDEEEANRLRHGLSLLSVRDDDKGRSRLQIDAAYSTIGPARHASWKAPAPNLEKSANILSLRVLESDVAYPLRLYGTVIVGDDLDRQCLYLFHRHLDQAQLLTSQDESLTLIGPQRGLLVFGSLYFEFHLKMRIDQQIDDESSSDDQDFSKGYMYYDAVMLYHKNIIKDQLASRLSTMELTYASVNNAVEAAVHIRVCSNLQSPEVESRRFFGKITAQTTDIAEDFVLYDDESCGNMMAVGKDGTVELHRSVIAVPIAEELSVRIDAWDSGKANHYIRTINFAPDICGEHVVIADCRFYEVEVKVVWSALYVPEFDDTLRKPESLAWIVM